MKIMIVDDHADMRRILRNYIRLTSEKPIQIVDYETGEEAMQEYIAQQPDFVFMDIELKSISGFVVSEEILKISPEAKIIIVTSYDTPGFRQKAQRLGICGFVAKDKLSDIHKFLTFK